MTVQPNSRVRRLRLQTKSPGITVSDNPVRVNEVLTMFAQLDLGKIAQPTVECPLSICSDGIYGEASSW